MDGEFPLKKVHVLKHKGINLKADEGGEVIAVKRFDPCASFVLFFPSLQHAVCALQMCFRWDEAVF